MKSIKRIGLAACISFSMTMPAIAKTNLTMYYPIAVGGPLTKVVDGMVKKFEQANPDIKVKAIYSGNYDNTRVRALSALAAGHPPQLAVMFSIDAYDLINQGVIIPFSGMKGVTTKWLNSFYPALMANSRIDGKIWSIPFQRSTIVEYYNKDMFRKAGLDPNKPPMTWGELVKVGKALTKNGTYGLMIPSTGYPYWMFQALAIENGEALMSKSGKKTYFNDPKVIQALQFWRSLSTKYGIMPKGTIQWGTLRQAFLDGRTAIMWNSTGNLTAVRKGAKFDFGVAQLPTHVRPGSPTGGGNFYIFKKSTPKQRAAALKLIKFMTSPKEAAAWSIATGYMGVSPAAYQTKALKKYTEEFPQALVARNQLKNAVAELATYQGARVREALNNAIQAALTGSKSPKAALDDAQAKAVRLLRDYQ